VLSTENASDHNPRPPGATRIDLRAFSRLTELADYFVPFTIRAVAALGVADELAAGPRTVQQLAAATAVDARSLRRALRALACKGIFTESDDGQFALTPLAELLRADHPLSLRDAYHLMPADVAAWADIEYSLRTGLPAFDHVHGQGLWDWLRNHPHESAQFDRGMQAMTKHELRALSAAYDWRSLRLVADVGGGNGALLAGLLSHHPGLRGILFDLPHVVDGAAEVLRAAGVADRCEIRAGSFLERVPEGPDAYLLKRILYGWDDRGAARVLGAVRAAMTPTSRLLVVEPVLDVLDRSGFGAILDLVMLVIDGGHARSTAELAELFGAAGLELTGVVETVTFPIVEARPR
jgi:precorrin-6B methylase 2